MTREEAIAYAERVITLGLNDETQAFCQMAIKALEQERSRLAQITQYRNDCEKLMQENEQLKKALEQEPCKDAVSRQAVLEMAYDMSEIDGEHFTEPWMVVDVEDIQKLPPVKPQEKTRHWIRGHHGFGCSNCHKSIEGEWDDDIDDITGTLFCPNCGARMVEPQKSEDKE